MTPHLLSSLRLHPDHYGDVPAPAEPAGPAFIDVSMNERLAYCLDLDRLIYHLDRIRRDLDACRIREEDRALLEEAVRIAPP